jgi:2-oxoglutarate ferredoxin oxidoreductase subunit delta
LKEGNVVTNKATENSESSQVGPSTTPQPKDSEKRKKHFTQFIFGDWCKACGICSAFCPKDVITRSATGMPIIQDPDACIGCRFCELHCPDFAITIREDNGNPTRNGA